MSPEQASGERDVGPESDQYSLGVVLYEMLAGRPPFSEGSPVAVAAAHVHQEPPPLGELAPEAPRHVVAAVHRALAKDPADRPRSAGDFAAMLRSPSPATPAPGPEPETTQVVVPADGTAVLPAVAESGTPPMGLPVTPAPPKAGRARPTGPRRPRRAFGGAFLGLLAAVVILLVALALILNGSAPTPFGTATPTPSASHATVAVPNVLAQKEGDAKKALKAAGLKVGDIKHVEGPDGIVVDMRPLPGTVVRTGSPVTLYVGSTPPPAPNPGKGHGNGNGKGKEGD
jgi:serine/threonine-protein kinase